jgi:hypothetical protein
VNAWLEQWFDEPKQANRGGVIRRNVNDVARYTSVDEVVIEARSRGWHVIETGDQLVVLCHDGDMRIFC